MANPDAPKLKVKVYRIGRYAGPTVRDLQFETTSSNEEVDLPPAFAAYIVDNENGEIIPVFPKKTRAKKDNPPKVDKDNAETA